MKYNLTLARIDDTTDTLVYDTEENTLFSKKQNEYISLSEEDKKKIHPQKSVGITVRLSMGKKCNFNCKYCHQCKDVYTQKKMPNLLDEIIRVTEGHIEGIQFWGGEPFMYFDTMKEIVKEIQEKFPKRDFHVGTCTNGSFLGRKDVQEWILDNNIEFTISYDGKGQFLRGVDVLTPEVIDFLHRLKEKDPEYIPHFNPVITKEMHDPFEYTNDIQTRIGMDVAIGEVRPIMITNETSLACATDPDELPQYFQSLYRYLIEHRLDNWVTTGQTVRRVMETIGHRDTQPIYCFVNSPRTLTLDLEGNILTCQSFNADDTDEYGNHHKLEHIRDINDLRKRKTMDLQKTIEIREKYCTGCLVRTVCKGGCPFLPSQYRQINCQHLYWHNLAIFLYAIQCVIDDKGIITEIDPFVIPYE